MILKSHFRTQADNLAKGQSQDISNAHVSSLFRTPNMISLLLTIVTCESFNLQTYGPSGKCNVQKTQCLGAVYKTNSKGTHVYY